MAATRTYKLTIEYDGADFNGWQSQPNGRTVQDVVEAALAKVLGEHVRIHGSCRTDSGVHALGQVAHFRTSILRKPSEILLGCNANLPEDVALRGAVEVDGGFNARRDAIFRTYQYRVFNASHRPVLERRRALHVPQKLDFGQLAEACGRLKGAHDFSAFRSVDCTAKRTRLTMRMAEARREGELIVFDFGCRSFLMNMIRIIAGTLLEVGKGRLPPAVIGQMLDSGERTLGGPTAPPHGLTLISVQYARISRRGAESAED